MPEYSDIARKYLASERAGTRWPPCERCGGRMTVHNQDWVDMTPYGMPRGEREYLVGRLSCTRQGCTAG
jgi:hypothetical protein